METLHILAALGTAALTLQKWDMADRRTYIRPSLHAYCYGCGQ